MVELQPVKYKEGDKFVGPRYTFYIHYVVDRKRILFRTRLNAVTDVTEQTLAEWEIDDILETFKAKKA